MLSLYVPSIRDALSLSEGTFGSLYSIATLASSFLLLLFGKRVDQRPLIPYTVSAIGLLSLSCVLLANARHPIILFVSLVGLRFSGQGLMTNISQTVMSRYFERSRGKALSLSSLGFSFGELILPFLAGFLMIHFGWRVTIISVAGILAGYLLVILGVLPVKTYEKRLEADKISKTGGNLAEDISTPEKDFHFFLLMARNPHFGAIAPAVGILSMVTTGFFFYQMILVEQNGWASGWYALMFGAYALARVVSSLVIGPAIDRFGARRLYPFHLLPMSLAFILLGLSPSTGIVPVFLISAGVTMGTGSVLKSTIYADVFGVRRLGEVRSLFASIMVLGTALGPILFGTLMDQGMPMERILMLCGISSALCALASFRVWKRYSRASACI